jgi:hypothetical protein
MSVQEMGHLGGIGRWHGHEAVEEEKKKMRLSHDGKSDGSSGNNLGGQSEQSGQQQQGGQGGTHGQDHHLTRQELGHLGGIGRWHGHEAVEEEKKKMGLSHDGNSDESGNNRGGQSEQSGQQQQGGQGGQGQSKPTSLYPTF